MRSYSQPFSGRGSALHSRGCWSSSCTAGCDPPPVVQRSARSSSGPPLASFLAVNMGDYGYTFTALPALMVLATRGLIADAPGSL